MGKIQSNQPPYEFLMHDKYLFKENRLCVARSSLWKKLIKEVYREKLIKEVHREKLSGHLRRVYSIAGLKKKFC